MPVGTATITSKAGPNETVTAQVFQNVLAFTVDIARQVLQLWFSQPSNGPAKEFDISANTTMTTTFTAGGNWTITLS